VLKLILCFHKKVSNTSLVHHHLIFENSSSVIGAYLFHALLLGLNLFLAYANSKNLYPSFHCIFAIRSSSSLIKILRQDGSQRGTLI